MKKKTKIIIGVIAVLLVIGAIKNIISPNENGTSAINTNVPNISSDNTQPIAQIPKAESTNFEESETKSDSEIIFDFANYDTSYEDVNFDGLTAKYGELLSIIYSDGTVTVKTKIEPSYNNKATIEQNYFTVADLVKNHGFNTCEKLSYWAVADMSNGEESKCISFDLNKNILTELYNGNIVENQLGNYAADLWILPSLHN